jgi:uncharacterized glyoxalase superfamily protein PhnB
MHRPLHHAGMTTSRYQPIELSQIAIGLDRTGTARPLPSPGGPPPSIDGLTVGAAVMNRDAPHRGEMHPDGDELLYLVAGSVDVILEEDGAEHSVELKPGQALVVPRGIWHRVALREPSHLVYVTPGPNARHRPLDAASPAGEGSLAVESVAPPAPVRPLCDQVNVVARDMDGALTFYRRLGLSIPEGSRDWPPGSGARHTEVAMSSGFRLEFDNLEMTKIWYPDRRDELARGGGAVMSFALPSREAVDHRYAELTAAGYIGCQAPYDAFWGSRFAIVQDPDGNDVGLMGPPDPARRFVPRT